MFTGKFTSKPGSSLLFTLSNLSGCNRKQESDQNPEQTQAILPKGNLV